MHSCVDEAQDKDKTSDTLNARTEAIADMTNGEVKSALDCLEKLFNNDNYYLIKDKDTSYFYFTRLNDVSMFTHAYKMIQGDSARLRIDTIQLKHQNNISWVWQDESILLDSVSNITARWLNTNTSTFIEFNKNNSGVIVYKTSTGSTIQLNKTPQISLFLTRSWHDYQNGTHFAFDTSNYTKKH